MRTIQLIPGIPKEPDLGKFPDSTIINQTDTQEGTPVAREVYGDILTNLYKVLREAGITANGNEDNELNGYQLVQALQMLPNLLNDVEQPLSLAGTVFSVPLDLNFLPDRYCLVVRAAQDYVSSVAYTFKGSAAAPAYSFTAVTSFKSGDELLLIIDDAGVRAINLTPDETQSSDVFAPFGTPMAFNNGNKVYYQSEGILFSDLPELADLQATIRVAAGDGTILVYEMLIISGYVICLCFYPNTLTYKLYQISLLDLGTPVLMTITGAAFPVGSDNKPYIFTDGVKVLITNSTGTNATDAITDEFSIDLANHKITKTGSVTFADPFAKTTNAAISGNYLFTLINGNLQKYSIADGSTTFIGSYPGYIGILFAFNGSVYYTNGEVAKKWAL